MVIPVIAPVIAPLLTLAPFLIGLAPQDDERFAASPEGAKVVQLEQALPGPAMVARVVMQELHGGKVTSESRCEVSIERPMRFRLAVSGEGGKDLSDLVISNGHWITHFVAAENRYQLEEATPFSTCSYLPPVIAFAALMRPRDWFRSQEALAIVESVADDVLKVEVNGVPGLLHLGKLDHLPKLIELDAVDADGAGKVKFVTRLESLEQKASLPAATFLFEPQPGVKQDPPSDAPEPPLIAVGSVTPAIKARDPSGEMKTLEPTAATARIVVFWFQGGAQSEVQLEALGPVAAAQRAQLVAIHCGDATDAARERVKKLGASVIDLQDEPASAKGMAETLIGAWRVPAFPTTYVVAPDGKVIDRFVGRDRDRVEKALRAGKN